MISIIVMKTTISSIVVGLKKLLFSTNSPLQLLSDSSINQQDFVLSSSVRNNCAVVRFCCYSCLQTELIPLLIKFELGVISLRLRLIILNGTLIILDITKTESRIVLLYIERKKIRRHGFASSLTASNTKRANLT